MTDEEAAVIDAAYGVDQAFFPPEPDRAPSVFLARLDNMHQAILQLEQTRKAAAVTE
jgi:hypothetical protein